MQRRDFLKATCRLCLLGTAGLLVTQTGCAPATGNAIYKTAISNNEVEVPLALFDKAPLQYIRPNGWYYDIAVQKNQDGFTALLMQCTHQNNQLTLSGDTYYCNLHGSTFDKNGQVKKGPAEEPLKKYKTTVKQNNLIIQIA